MDLSIKIGEKVPSAAGIIFEAAPETRSDLLKLLKKLDSYVKYGFISARY